jgi:nucleoid-associated protein YgaU
VHNLLTGVFLIAIAALAAAALLFHRVGSPLDDPAPPKLEADPVGAEDDSAYVLAVVGSERNPPAPASAPPPLEEDARDVVRRKILGDPTEVVKAPGADGVLVIRVARGDTLASLAREHLGDARLWPAILEANPDLGRPENLREGGTLRIPLREAR